HPCANTLCRESRFNRFASLGVIKSPKLKLCTLFCVCDKGLQRRWIGFCKDFSHRNLPRCPTSWVEAIAQPVTEKIEAKNSQQNRKARKYAYPPCCLQICTAIC